MDSNNTRGIVFGAVAAILGSLLWAGIAYATEREIGWIAIGVGALIGAAVKMGGGKGAPGQLGAGGLAILAICVGKLITVSWMVGHYVENDLAQELTQELYAEIAVDVEDYKSVNPADEDAVKAYMASHGYSWTNDPAEIEADELQFFLDVTAPDLMQKASTGMPSYDVWRAEQIADAKEAIGDELDTWTVLKETTGAMDVLFFVLAVVAAFQLVAKEEN